MSTSPSNTSITSLLLSIPVELREYIWSLYLKPADRLVRCSHLDEEGFYGGVYHFDFALWRVNRQIYSEAKSVWQRENIFVKIATPWSGAVNHIASEGLVPIVCAKEKAEQFQGEHALVTITAPFNEAASEHTVVVLLDDVHLFAQTWYYSALTYPLLNHRLKTTFTLQAPATIPLQQKILFPFEHVKELYSMEAIGFSQHVTQELQRRMAVPLPTLSACCDQATHLLAQGDAALAVGNPTAALTSYTEAFKAIHILIDGRTRRVLADSFFHDVLPDGQYAGQTGMAVRITLRLRLVARTMAAHLALAAYADAAFWGLRSIRLMHDALDAEFEDAWSAFPPAADLALIHVRTAVAFWKMETAREVWGTELEGFADEGATKSGQRWASAARYAKFLDKEAVRKELVGYGVGQEILHLF